MKIETVTPQLVVVGERHRSTDPNKVKEIAQSMSDIGQLQPITVYCPDDSTVYLVAGRHRLEAAISLGWEDIEAVFVAGDEIEREIIEIAENLCRADLTRDERDRQVRRYAELLKTRGAKPLVGQSVVPTGLRKDGRVKGPQHQKGIASTIADATGLSTRTVQRALSLTPRPPKPPAPLNDVEARDRWVAMGLSWWNRGNKEWREEFLNAIDRPVMDARLAS